jgi:signal transduction histidine kinase
MTDVTERKATAAKLDEARERFLSFDCDLTPTVRADRMRLGQVFDNLISYAIKFAPAGGQVGLTVSMVGADA